MLAHEIRRVKSLPGRAFLVTRAPKHARREKQLSSQRHAVRLQPSHAPALTTTLISICRHVYRASAQRHGHQGGASEGYTPSSHQQHLNE